MEDQRENADLLISLNISWISFLAVHKLLEYWSLHIW